MTLLISHFPYVLQHFGDLTGGRDYRYFHQLAVLLGKAESLLYATTFYVLVARSRILRAEEIVTDDSSTTNSSCRAGDACHAI